MVEQFYRICVFLLCFVMGFSGGLQADDETKPLDRVRLSKMIDFDERSGMHLNFDLIQSSSTYGEGGIGLSVVASHGYENILFELIGVRNKKTITAVELLIEGNDPDYRVFNNVSEIKGSFKNLSRSLGVSGTSRDPSKDDPKLTLKIHRRGDLPQVVELGKLSEVFSTQPGEIEQAYLYRFKNFNDDEAIELLETSCTPNNDRCYQVTSLLLEALSMKELKDQRLVEFLLSGKFVEFVKNSKIQNKSYYIRTTLMNHLLTTESILRLHNDALKPVLVDLINLVLELGPNDFHHTTGVKLAQELLQATIGEVSDEIAGRTARMLKDLLVNEVKSISMNSGRVTQDNFGNPMAKVHGVLDFMLERAGGDNDDLFDRIERSETVGTQEKSLAEHYQIALRDFFFEVAPAINHPDFVIPASGRKLAFRVMRFLEKRQEFAKDRGLLFDLRPVVAAASDQLQEGDRVEFQRIVDVNRAAKRRAAIAGIRALLAKPFKAFCSAPLMFPFHK